jgi:hypothetical protein
MPASYFCFDSWFVLRNGDWILHLVSPIGDEEPMGVNLPHVSCWMLDSRVGLAQHTEEIHH